MLQFLYIMPHYREQKRTQDLTVIFFGPRIFCVALPIITIWAVKLVSKRKTQIMFILRFAASAFILFGLLCVLLSMMDSDPVLHRSALATPRVHVSVCVEALCSGCKLFMNEQLYPAYQLFGETVLDLTVTPFGNSVINQDGAVECQHGPAECDANIYEQCAVDIYKHASRYLPYLYCLDNALAMGFRNESFSPSIFAECAVHSALDYKSIATCHAKQGPQMQRKFAKKTPSDHQYVPWVTVNGIHTMDNDNESLIDVICKAIHVSGGHHSACESFTWNAKVRSNSSVRAEITTTS
jgi:interferon gamma-inducible protein 30